MKKDTLSNLICKERRNHLRFLGVEEVQEFSVEHSLIGAHE